MSRQGKIQGPSIRISEYGGFGTGLPSPVVRDQARYESNSRSDPKNKFKSKVKEANNGLGSAPQDAGKAHHEMLLDHPSIYNDLPNLKSEAYDGGELSTFLLANAEELRSNLD